MGSDEEAAPENTDAQDNSDANNTMKVLDKHCNSLMEHFDTVQIVVTRHLKDGTRMANYGAGNLYARLASAREWLNRMDMSVEMSMYEEDDQDG